MFSKKNAVLVLSFSFLFVASTYGFQTQDSSRLPNTTSVEKQGEQALEFEDKCTRAKCEIRATLHGRVSDAKGFVVSLTPEQQKIYGKKMLVFGSGHQFLNWSDQIQPNGHGSIRLRFLHIDDETKISQEILYNVEAQYLHHEVNRKYGDYSILTCELTEKQAESIKPIKLAPRGLSVERNAKLFASSVPGMIAKNEAVEIFSIFRYNYAYNQEYGFYDRSLEDAKVVIASLEALHGCSGGALIMNLDGEPVVLGNCINRLGKSKQSPANFLLGTGLIGPQAESEVKNKMVARGVMSMFNHVDVLHNALDRACEKENSSQLKLSMKKKKKKKKKKRKKKKNK